MTMFSIALTVVLVAYAVFAVAMYKCQHLLVYRIDSRRIPPARIGLSDVDEITLEVPSGERLVAWHGEARPGKPTVLYLHGQAGTLGRRAERIRRYRAAGIGILIVAYRGFSGSSGTPSEQANVADALFAHDWLLAKGVATKDIIVYGESLGTGVAVQVAALRAISGLVLDSPFTALTDLAAARHPYLPVRRFIFDRYETLSHVGKSKAPVLVLQGEKDPIVPLPMALRVFEAIPGPKRMITFSEGRHLDHGKFGSFDVVLRFLNERARLPHGYSKMERVVPAALADNALPAGSIVAARA
jgi:uncharacterized protein